MSTAFGRLCSGLASAAWVLFGLALAGLAALALMLVLGWLPELWAPGLLGPDARPLVLQRLLLWGLAALVAAPGLVALATMAGLFGAFARGEVFTDFAARAIRRVGLMLVVGAVLKVVAGAARSVVVTYTNPPGERMLAVSVGSEEALLVLLGGLLVVIGQAMAEAARMEREMRAII